jgi:hypothetical protein
MRSHVASLAAGARLGLGMLLTWGLIWGVELWSLTVHRLWAAEPLKLTFDAPSVSWRWDNPGSEVKLLAHERDHTGGRDSGAESIRFVCRKREAMVRFSLPITPCRVLDELEASVWIRAPHPGWSLALRVVTPGIIDPATGDPAHVLVRGDTSRETGRWECLRCRTADREVGRQLVQLRAKISGAGEPGEMYVDQVLLAYRAAEPGESWLLIDDLELKPIVPASPVAPPVATPPMSTQPPVVFRLDRIQVAGRPFFPRLVRDHGEAARRLAESGCNLVWVDDVKDSSRLQELRAHQLWAVATPPRPENEAGRPLGATSAGLLPFTESTDAVLCWLMGIRLGAADRKATLDWIEQVRAADRRRDRPIAAEVVAEERGYSRDVQLLGMSRHVLGTTVTLADYRDWLMERRSAARPGAFCWTWIQCEPQPAALKAVSTWGAPPQIEPEQIRLQVYAALAAGYRGIGYWTTQSLDLGDPLTRERFLAIQQVNLELQLLEPWLATAGGAARIPCRLGSSPGQTSDGTWKALTNAAASARNLLSVSANRPSGETSGATGLSATVLRTDHGTLVLPVWLDRASQFVPAQAAGHHLTLVVPGVEQSAAAYEVSPTAIIGLGGGQRERVAGGVQITLPRFDQLAVIWLTSDLGLVETMRQRIAAVQQVSAMISLELARLKLDRVGQVDLRLQEVGARKEDGPQIVGRAKLALEHAQAAYDAKEFHRARLLAEESMQALRILQRLHWDDAVRHLASPVSSPYTLCFQTLPEHWQLINRLGRASQREAANLLPSGSFEDRDTLIAEGWQHTQTPIEGLRADASLVPRGRKSQYALRLACSTTTTQNGVPALTQPAVTYATPPLHVRADQLLHISGWVKIERPLAGQGDGLQISESILGRSAGVRFREAPDWTRFELLREVVTTGEWQLTMALYGIGEAQVDDLQVLALDLPPPHTADDEPSLVPAGGTGILDRLPRFPGLSPRRR